MGLIESDGVQIALVAVQFGACLASARFAWAYVDKTTRATEPLVGDD